LTIKICPHCNERYVVDWNITDYVHECNSGNNTLDQEDVVVVGNWEDYSGNGEIGAQEVLMQGNENQLQGKDSQIKENKDKENLTRRGVRASTRRQRQHYEYIEGIDCNYGN